MKKMSRAIGRIKENPKRIVAYVNATGALNFLPEKSVVKILWWTKTGKWLDVGNPKTFNEKLQWLKINNHNPKLTTLVDKYLVRGYIRDLLGEEYLIPLIGCWDNLDEIDFDSLPDQFVLKCNHNAAIGLCVCRDKKVLNADKVKKELRRGLSSNFYYSSREWAYKNVQRRIICEKYMEDGSGNGLRDYKFFCFNGEAKFIYISEGLENHETARISFYGFDGKEMPFHRRDYRQFSVTPAFPDNIQEMIEIANKIASQLAGEIGLPFARVDLYSIQGKTYFSEITLYPNSGYIPFEPGIWDEKIGEWIDLSMISGK